MYIPWEFPLRMHRPKLVMKNDPYQQTPHSLVFQLEGLVCKYHKPRQLKKKTAKHVTFFVACCPWRFCRKTCFEACWVVFWSLSCYKELKPNTKLFIGCTVCSQTHNISLWSLSMCRKQNFEIGLKVTQQCWLFLFAFSSPIFFCFTCLIYFSLAGHLVGFILVGKVFRKAFRIFGLDERKGRWVVEQDFHANFQVNVTWFLAFFYGVLDWIVLILVWFDRVVKGAGCRRKSAPTWLVSTGYSAWHFFMDGVFKIKYPWTGRLLWQLSRQLQNFLATLVWKISSLCTN